MINLNKIRSCVTKGLKLASAAAFALVAVCTSMSAVVHADNPIIQTSYTPDPAPMVWNDTFYLYTGHDADNASGYEMPDWQCFSTTDMKNWVNHGVVLSSEDFEWGEPGTCWAAQCVERNGKFYYYVTISLKNDGARCIGVAVADSPTGPFKDAIGGPLCGPNWSYIDPTVLIDDDGQAYLYFGNPNLYYVKLKDNMIETDGEIEMSSMTAKHFGESRDGLSTSYEEGPWIYKRNGLYYMVYAASGVPETIDYSISEYPTSHWQYKGMIMDTCPTSFTIHPGIIEYKGHSYFTYHTGDLEGGGGFTRSGAIEEFTFGEDGSIPKIEATREGPDQIECLNPYVEHVAETICREEGIKIVQTDDDIYVSKCSNGDYIKLAGVNFAEKATSFTASASAVRTTGTLELRLDSVDGKVIGTVEIPQCESDEAWQTLTCDVSGASGVHDLYFVFSVDSGRGYANFDKWQFDGIYDPDDFPPAPPAVVRKSSSQSALIIAVAAAVVIAVVIIAIPAAKGKGKKKAE